MKTLKGCTPRRRALEETTSKSAEHRQTIASPFAPC
jgi:hypothetical protein